MISWIKSIIAKIKQEIQYRKRLKELKKKDPFIYKQDMAVKQRIKFREPIQRVIEKTKKVLEKKPKYQLIELYDIDCKEDPVRPELDLKFRTEHGRKIYGLKDEAGDIAAKHALQNCGRQIREPGHGDQLPGEPASAGSRQGPPTIPHIPGRPPAVP